MLTRRLLRDRHCIYLYYILLAISLFFPVKAHSETSNATRAKVDNLVRQHYFRGIPYLEAHSLGPEAIPYLLDKLNDPVERDFWVNIVVTLGFIEDGTSVEPLVSYLENNCGEVDVYKFKALISVPFAIGCIASTGDRNSLNYLIEMTYSLNPRAVEWKYRGIDIDSLMVLQAITGLAISGRQEAREALEDIKTRLKNDKSLSEQDVFLQRVTHGLKTLNRINRIGRSEYFEPTVKSFTRNNWGD
jgi:hypothetical protein